MQKAIAAILLLLLHGNIYAYNCDSALVDWSRHKNRPYYERKTAILNIIQTAGLARDKQCLANAYRRLGNLYKQSESWDSAAYAYISSAGYAEDAKDITSAASSYNQVGVVYNELENNPLALKYFVKACDNYRLLNDYRGLSDAKSNCAEIYLKMDRLEQAEQACRYGMTCCRRQRDTSLIGGNYNLLAAVYLKRVKIHQALAYARTAIGIYRSQGDTAGLVAALLQAGHIYLKTGITDTAVLQYREAYRYALLIQSKRQAADASLYLSKAFEAGNKADSALYYLQQHCAAHDALQNETVLRRTMEMATKYDTEKKDAEILHQQQLSENRLLLIIVLVLFILILLFAIAIIVSTFAQRKKIAQKESEIQSINALLRGQDTERERIARELHDRVGSMLSTVKLHLSNFEAPLQIQQKASHATVAGLLDDTYDEVRRISHNLDSGSLKNYGFTVAMHKLTQSIEATSKLRVAFIDKNMTQDDYDQCGAGLFRITQELLNNTIKYAAASEINIQVSKDGTQVVYVYEDDGKGFSKSVLDNNEGVGFRNIDYRIKKMNGTWHLDTVEGHGMSVIIKLPT